MSIYDLFTSPENNRDTLIAEIKREQYNLSKRIKRINSGNYTRSALSASKQYAEYMKKYGGQSYDEATDKELLSRYRQLTYIDKLKTSTVKGAEQAQKRFVPIENMLSQVSQTKQDEFWEVYEKLFERMGSVIEQYKYEVFDYIADSLYIESGDPEDAVRAIEYMYDETLHEVEDYDFFTKNRKTPKLFISKLKGI